MDDLTLNETIEETSAFVGEVVVLRMDDGVYKRPVRFGDGRLLNYEAGQLANRAHKLHVCVTS
jgi:hypothetical protein